MIQVYSPGNEEFDRNGDFVLTPTLCELQMELNGDWSMELEHPIDPEGRWKFLETGAVIMSPAPMGEKQLFRIYETQKTDREMTAYARPIFFDAADEVFLIDTRPTNKNGQQALDIMMDGTRFTGKSDIKDISTAYYVRKNIMEAIAGDGEESFLNRWGGEILYDNRKIIVNERAGGDYGLRIQYGKNLTEINETVNMEEVITRIIPVAYNGYTLEGDAPWVDSPNIEKYPVIYAREVEFDDVKLEEDAREEENGFPTLAELRTELVRRCEALFETGVDRPTVNLEIKMIDLSKTEEYKEYQVLEMAGLGDTVHCEHKKLGIVSEARVIRVVWDCINQKAVEMELGKFTYDYFSKITSSAEKINKVTDQDGNLIAESIKGIIDANMTRLHAMRNIAQNTGQRAILFEDRVEGSPTYGAMAIGTTGFLIASERTVDGRDWKWSTFGSAQGFYATYLIAGVLSSRNFLPGQQGFRLNLDAGTIESKHLNLNDEGLLKIKNAMIDGGQFTMTDQYGDVIFGVSENGFGFGGDAVTYYSGDEFITLDKDLRLISGKMVGYASNGKKGIEVNGTTLKMYSWNSLGDWVGSIGSVKSGDRVGIALWCDSEDFMSLGIKGENDTVVKNVIQIDGSNSDSPPWIRGGASGTIKIADTGNSRNHEITVKNGVITNWNTYAY